MTLVQSFNRLEDTLNAELLERGREIHGALIALIARKHMLMVGPPGTAKSFLVRRIVGRIDFGEKPTTVGYRYKKIGVDESGNDILESVPVVENRYDDEAFFQWLLTKYTTPEEVFGPPDLAELRKGRYVRNTEGKMSRSKITFADEYRRANSSILNSLLTIMNERLFFNAGTHSQVPLDTVFSGTNNFEADDDLHAIDDRFLLRYEVRELQENGSVLAMLEGDLDDDLPFLVTYEQLQQAQAEARQVRIPQEIKETIISLRDLLREAGVEPSDRRFKECLALVKAEAWINGRDTVEIDDLRILRHVMWSRLDEQSAVNKAVLELSNPLDKEANDHLETVGKLEAELRKQIKEADTPKALANEALEIYGKLQKVKKKMDALKVKVVESGRRSEILDQLELSIATLAKRLMKEGFSLPGAS